MGLALGLTLGITSSVSAYNQEQENARAQAALLRRNQRMEERGAARIEAETAENVRRQRAEAARLKAAQRALLGASGAAMAGGSPLAILGDTAAIEELKIRDTTVAGARAAAQHADAAVMAGYQARAAKAAAPSRSALVMDIANQVNDGVMQAAGMALSLM